MKNWMLLGVILLILCVEETSVYAQDSLNSGQILSISGKAITVLIGKEDVSVGEVVEFWRYKNIVDPVTGNERGSTKSIIARGVIDEIGLGKAFATITEQIASERIDKSDRAIFTGSQKNFTRKTGKVQEITSDKKMVIDLGKEDEVSEGDTFLIQRTENVYDTKTKKLTGTNQIEIGKGKIEAVNNKTSIASVSTLQPGMIVRKTDNVVFNPDQKAAPGGLEMKQLQGEVDSLKHEMLSLKSMMESLNQNRENNRKDFALLISDFERILPSLMSGDISGNKIVLKNNQSISRNTSKILFDRYKQALQDCLGRNFQKSTREFIEIIQKYPNSPLTENCRYWIALSSFTSADYTRAVNGFREIIEDTRFTHKDDDAAVMLGISYFQMGQLNESKSAFQLFMEKYPASEYRNTVSHWIEKLAATIKRG
jgi:TolA-binding protein